MNHISEVDIMSAAPTLRAGGVVVLRTDTIYGIVARADDENACERVYQAKGRDANKPCIVLIADDAQIWDGASREAFTKVAADIGDEATSIIVPSGENTPEWIPHENNTVAFRIPNKPELRRLLLSTGPLIAPSANPSGAEPAANVEQAETYFGDTVDLYVDAGTVSNMAPSRVVRVNQAGEIEHLR